MSEPTRQHRNAYAPTAPTACHGGIMTGLTIPAAFVGIVTLLLFLIVVSLIVFLALITLAGVILSIDYAHDGHVDLFGETE